MEILVIPAIIISIMAISRANNAMMRVKALEEKLKVHEDLKNMLPRGKAVNQGEGQQYVETRTEDIVSKEDAPKELEEYKESALLLWLKEDWLLKLGGILVIMGVLFFMSLAYKEVGPQGKVIIGYLFGLSLMVLGFWYAKRQLIGGSAIHVIGATVILITTYLARTPAFNLFDPYFAMTLMFLTTVCVSLTAYAYNRSALAHVGLVMAGLVPVLAFNRDVSFFEIQVYLAVVTLGVLWLALVTKWRSLVLWSLAIVGFYFISHIQMYFGREALPAHESYMAVLFGGLFYLTSLFSIFRGSGDTGKVDGLIALVNAGYLYMWVAVQFPITTQPIILAIIALVYAFGFFMVYKLTNVYTSFIVYGGVSLGLLTAAIMLRLTGSAETIVLLLIATGASILTYHLSRNETVTKALTLLHLIPGALVMGSIARASYSMMRTEALVLVWDEMLVIGFAMVTYFALYAYFKKRIWQLAGLFLFAAIGVSTVFVWDMLHLMIQGGFATFLSIFVYTVIGLIMLYIGTEEGNETKVRLSRLWLGLVAARVIFWDAWQVGSIPLGVLICISVGVLLLSSTFIIKKVAR